MSSSGVNTHMPVAGLWKRLQGNDIGAILARGASGALFVSVLGAAMAFATNVLLARLMGVTQYGIYIYALTWVNLLALVCKLGMDTSLIRFVAAYNAKSQWGLFRGILGLSVRHVFMASIFIGVSAALVVWFLQDRIGMDQAKSFWLALILLPLLGLTALRGAALRALRHIVQSGLPDNFIRPLLIASLAGLAYLYTQQNLLSTQVMMFNIVGALIAFYIGTIWLFKALPEQLHNIQPVYAGAEWIKVSLPLFFISGMHLILHQTDIIMIGVILDTEQVGFYAVASRIAGLVLFGLTAVNAIVAPMISELYSTGQYQKLQKMITLAARGIFVITLVVSLSLVILGEYILGLFGDEFVAGYMALLILLVGQAINALAGSVGFLMTMTGHQNKAAQILGVSAIINIILNVILISRFGVIGAAIATAVSTALWNILMLGYIWRRLNFNPTIFAKG